MKRNSILLPVIAALLLGGCQSAYYCAMEKVGYQKRDILMSRVQAARDSQEDAKQEITGALDQFGKVVSYQGGELEAQYEKLSGKLKDAQDAANEVHERVRDVEEVGSALFEEWKSELSQYANLDLRAKSEQQLGATRAR